MLNSEHGSIDAACGSVSREIDHMLPFSEVCGQRVLAAATAPFPNRVSSLSQRLLRGKRCVAVVDGFGVFGMGTAAPITTTSGQNRANQHERKVSYVAVVRTIWITYRVCTSSQAVEKSPFGNRFQLIHERGPRGPHQIQRGSIHFISLSYEKDGESVSRRAKRVAEGESSVTTTIEEYVTALTLPYP